MDLQQPAKTETEILISVTDQELENFDSELAALCNGIKTPRQGISKDPGMMIMADLLKQVESNSEIYTQYQQDITQLKAKVEGLESTLPTNLRALILNAKAYQKDMETLSQNNRTLSNAYIEQFNINVTLAKKLEALEQEIKQNHDNDVELNTRYLELKKLTEASDKTYPRDINFLKSRIDLLENKQALSFFRFKCFATGVIGFLAGFLIWFYAHKAEFLR